MLQQRNCASNLCKKIFIGMWGTYWSHDYVKNPYFCNRNSVYNATVQKLFRCIYLTYFYMCKTVFAKKIFYQSFELSNFIAKCQTVFTYNCSMYINKFLLIFKIQLFGLFSILMWNQLWLSSVQFGMSVLSFLAKYWGVQKFPVVQQGN